MVLCDAHYRALPWQSHVADQREAERQQQRLAKPTHGRSAEYSTLKNLPMCTWCHSVQYIPPWFQLVSGESVFDTMSRAYLFPELGYEDVAGVSVSGTRL